MKRFYKLVTIGKNPAGFEIHLDGRPVKMPSGSVLCAPGEGLAAAMVREWAAQEAEIVPDTMPLTQILITAHDRVVRERAAMEARVLSYLGTDLLCYRAVLPAETARRQAEVWNPWLLWFERRYGVGLLTTESLQVQLQPPEAHAATEAAVKKLDDLEFTVLQLVVSQSGSLVLGLAFMDRAVTPEQILAATHVEENFKAEVYNEGRHGVAPNEEKRRVAMLRDLRAAQEFLKLL